MTYYPNPNIHGIPGSYIRGMMADYGDSMKEQAEKVARDTSGPYPIVQGYFSPNFVAPPAVGSVMTRLMILDKLQSGFKGGL